MPAGLVLPPFQAFARRFLMGTRGLASLHTATCLSHPFLPPSSAVPCSLTVLPPGSCVFPLPRLLKGESVA